MRSSGRLTTADIQAIFANEIAEHGGQVTDTFDDGIRLFTRSVLPRAEEVGPGDRVKSGVALRMSGGEVWLHPYVFRLVCRNGAIMAQAIQSRHLADVNLWEPDEAEPLIREAIRACCAPEAFTTAAGQMRSAQEQQVDLVLNLMPFLSRMSPRTMGGPIGEIMGRFFGDGDQSRFGLMNAVTAVARDTRDPETRWRLEEMGGAIAARITPEPSPRKPAAVAAERSETVLVG